MKVYRASAGFFVFINSLFLVYAIPPPTNSTETITGVTNGSAQPLTTSAAPSTYTTVSAVTTSVTQGGSVAPTTTSATATITSTGAAAQNQVGSMFGFAAAALTICLTFASG
ncbi:hypothetical protein RhiJN_14521 [Ceratobasidium sp. AG-Ba]|nr:hypothetical protein RhiJN_14521 [Ceratobasidium sp. AG-Ba]QRW15065.1 hypothetical protein RhiLY_14064 [Ceratobasidium sp. AG-Ba]